MIRLVGLTGGLATGKSLVCDYFRALGVPVLEADIVARTLTEPHTPAFHKIIAHFGSDFVTSLGTLDRARLRAHIFQHGADKTWLENLLHPLILKTLFEEAKTLSAPYVVLDIPLLLELHLKKEVDWVLVVDCSPAVQLSRALERDKTSKKTLEAMLAQQMPREVRLALADEVIVNEGTKDALKNKIEQFHQNYLKQQS